jgi:hypothetical protein
MSIFKRFLLVLSIQPATTSGNREQPSGTSSWVRAWGMTHTLDEEEPAHRDFESVIRGIEEDWECAQDIQQGLLNGRPPDSLTFTFGRFEGNDVTFLENVGVVAQRLNGKQNGTK